MAPTSRARSEGPTRRPATRNGAGHAEPTAATICELADTVMVVVARGALRRSRLGHASSAGLVAWAAVVAGCSRTPPGVTATPPSTMSAPVTTVASVTSALPATHPATDPPASTALALLTRYALPGSSWSIGVPSGWTRVDGHGSATFTSEGDAIVVSAAPRSTPPSIESLRADPDPGAGTPVVSNVRLQTLGVGAGRAIEATGMTSDRAFDTYAYWAGGVQVTVTLTHPAALPAPDAWPDVTASFTATS
jgi:hypothetical protein